MAKAGYIIERMTQTLSRRIGWHLTINHKICEKHAKHNKMSFNYLKELASRQEESLIDSVSKYII